MECEVALTRTWRGLAARVQFYFAEGNNALLQVKQVVYVCAAMKLLGVPVWVVVASAPVVYVAHVLAGWVWVQHGWYKQQTEVPVTDATNPVLMWQLHMLVRLYQQLGIPMNGVEVKEMPPEFREVLTSYRRP